MVWKGRKRKANDDVFNSHNVRTARVLHNIGNIAYRRSRNDTKHIFVYDIRKDRPINLEPVFFIREVSGGYRLIDTSTNKIISRTATLTEILKLASENLPNTQPK